MNKDEKLWTFIVFTCVSILCFGIGIGYFYENGHGWTFIGTGSALMTPVIIWVEKYLSKKEKSDG